jgi:hypothetical protein
VNITHILNIGYPKCGTTWCWKLLTQQTWFNIVREKENNDLLIGTTVADYEKSYINSEITANFSPANVALDRYIIKQLSELPTTKVSMILRNPFDLYWSLYNFLSDSHGLTYNDSLSDLINQSWFHRPAHIINRWQQFFGKERFQIFFYDEIQKDCSNFFNNYCKKMQLPDPFILDSSPANITQYTHKIREINPELVKIINQEIDNLQVCVDYDVLKWKQ